jgi:hypothetical protein
MVVRVLAGTMFVLIGIGLAGGIALGLRSRMFQVMPLPLRVLFRAAGLVTAGVLLPVILIFAVIAYSGSGIGDPGYSVTVENQMGNPVVFVVEGTNATPGSAMWEGVSLRPGAEWVDHWIIPSGAPFDDSKATVRARNAAGEQVYCHAFAFDELKHIRFHIELRPGVADCS